MGCILHAHIEVKKDGTWLHYANPLVQQNYQLFAAISGERADEIRPENRPRTVSHHHELPNDLSVVTQACLEETRDSGLHGFGYLTEDDIVALQNELYRVHPEVKRTGIDELDLEESIFRTYICGNAIASYHGFDDVRIVYWYDG